MSDPGRLIECQYNDLLKPLDSERIEKNESGQAYLPQWDVRRQLIRIFGFGGHNIETLDLDLIVDSRGENFVYVVYRAQVRLIVKDRTGREVGRWDDAAAADATGYRSPTPRQLGLGQAYHTAMTSALSTALRRCAVNLGDQLGLSLYNNGSADPVVVSTLLDPPRETEDEILQQIDEQGSKPDDTEWSEYDRLDPAQQG